MEFDIGQVVERTVLESHLQIVCDHRDAPVIFGSVMLFKQGTMRYLVDRLSDENYLISFKYTLK